MSEFGLYIHIPFCVRKCLYCDFLSFDNAENVKEDYMEALYKEIKAAKGDLSGRKIDTVFIGGGTPSTVSPRLLGKVLSVVTDELDLADDAEITTELNPGTVTEGSLSDYKAMGINRLSIGLQAYQNRILKTLGRIHTAEKFEETFALARKVGFKNINADIMFALPGQTMGDVKETLERLTELSPEHISAYSLIVEEGTPFKKMFDKGIYKETDEALDREMYRYICEYLKGVGYGRYEISNFAKNGFESRHNSIYWRTYEYKGFGLGASSYFNGERFHNSSDMSKYLKHSDNPQIIKEDVELLSYEDKISEFMFMGLRMEKGVSKTEFKNRFKTEMKSVFFETIEKYKEMGLLEETEDTLRLTDRGIDVSNVIFADFLL